MDCAYHVAKTKAYYRADNEKTIKIAASRGLQQKRDIFIKLKTRRGKNEPKKTKLRYPLSVSTSAMVSTSLKEYLKTVFLVGGEKSLKNL